jgi:hypothetical protein
MKVIRSSAKRVTVELGAREKELLLNLLELYPVVPADYQRVTRGAAHAAQEEAQKLLNEALAEQRLESKKRLQRLLQETGAFQETVEGRFRLNLTNERVEWLLQVLNDIRVGSWIALGSPEGKTAFLPHLSSPHLWSMEVAGLFQMSLLSGLERADET